MDTLNLKREELLARLQDKLTEEEKRDAARDEKSELERTAMREAISAAMEAVPELIVLLNEQIRGFLPDADPKNVDFVERVREHYGYDDEGRSPDERYDKHEDLRRAIRALEISSDESIEVQAHDELYRLL